MYDDFYLISWYVVMEDYDNIGVVWAVKDGSTFFAGDMGLFYYN